jgi:hypothetical protein
VKARGWREESRFGIEENRRSHIVAAGTISICPQTQLGFPVDNREGLRCRIVQHWIQIQFRETFGFVVFPQRSAPAEMEPYPRFRNRIFCIFPGFSDCLQGRIPTGTKSLREIFCHATSLAAGNVARLRKAACSRLAALRRRQL